MGNAASGGGLPPGFPGAPKKPEGPKKKYEPKPLTRVGKKAKKRVGGVSIASKLPKVFPTGGFVAAQGWGLGNAEQESSSLHSSFRWPPLAAKCKLRQMKLERIKDYLLLESEFIRNQEVLRPKAERETEQRDKVCGAPSRGGGEKLREVE